MMSINLDEFERVLDNLMSQTSDDNLANLLEVGAERLLRGMQRRVAVDSGELRDSLDIEITTHGDTAEVFIQAGTDHAEANEFGTHDMAAQPFMRPTMDEDGPQAIEDVSSAVGRALERLAR